MAFPGSSIEGLGPVFGGPSQAEPHNEEGSSNFSTLGARRECPWRYATGGRGDGLVVKVGDGTDRPQRNLDNPFKKRLLAGVDGSRIERRFQRFHPDFIYAVAHPFEGRWSWQSRADLTGLRRGLFVASGGTVGGNGPSDPSTGWPDRNLPLADERRGGTEKRLG